ncbi:MAG TPA: hypothetical protein VFV70_12370 [Hyphomonadaceae bacterium]|nr:hypothetical protein [Hyphomonadaceae bacterium]
MRMIALSVLGLLVAGAASAQVSPTEQYVPIGKTTAENVMLGEVVSVAAQPSAVNTTAPSTTAFTMETGGVERTYLIGPRTRIYVDLSRKGETSRLGGVADLREGRDVEAYVPDISSGVALWVKVRPQ